MTTEDNVIVAAFRLKTNSLGQIRAVISGRHVLPAVKLQVALLNLA